MKIVIVSTAYPLRGGIAQYAGILYNKLRANGHNVTVITFKRQYPNFLFPGKTQLETSEDPAVKIDSEPILDSIGPLSWFKAGKRLQQLQPDLILFKYWMPFFAPCFGTLCWQAKRNTRARILYICDNVIPHEKRIGDIKLTQFAFKHADHFIVQSTTVEKELLRLQPQADYKLIPHPVYDIFGELQPKQEARALLDISEEEVILFFGYVRAYKGLDWLLQAMPAVLKKRRIKLLVVGEFYDDEEKYRKMITELKLENAVQIHADFVPNEAVSKYFSAADAVVLPYKSATQSGIVQMAYHLDTPCIVTDVGGLSEVVLDGKTGFVVPPDNIGEISRAILRFFQEERAAEFSKNVNVQKKKYSWENMMSAIEEFTLPPKPQQ